MEVVSSYKVIFTWLFRLWQDHRLQAWINLLSGLFSVLLGLAFVWIMKLTVDIATGIRQDIALSWGLLGLVCVSFSQIVLAQINRWVRAVLGVRAQNRMQEQIFERLLKSEWTNIRKYHSGDILNRIVKDIGSVISLLTEDFPALITTVFQLLGAFLFLFSMDKRLAWIILCIAPLFLLISKLYVKKMRVLTHRIRVEESHSQSILQESIQHVLVIKTLEAIPIVCEKLHQTHRNLRRNVISKTKYASISSTIMNVGFSLGYLFTFTWGVYHLQKGEITYGALMAFIQLVGQIQNPIRTLTSYVPTFINVATACERLMDLEELVIEEEEKRLDSSFEEPKLLKIDNLYYRYTPTSRYVLRDLNFEFPPHSITAIIGETGAGKTTLIRSLLALIPVQEGKIAFIDEKKSISININTRTYFSYVPQGNSLISGTIRENLLLGNPRATDDEIRQVLDIAVADFVFSLPEGLNTSCSEMGGGLSEGQAQRICIARALLRERPIMLFDESTSALDTITEEIIVERIIDFCKGKTLIFITHRPAILKHCTQILRLMPDK